MKKYIKYKVINLDGGLKSILSEVRKGIYNSNVFPVKTNGWNKYFQAKKFIDLFNQNTKINNSQFINSILFSFKYNNKYNLYLEPLHYAITNDYTDMLDLQKYQPEDFNRTNYFGLTPLLLAIYLNKKDIVKKFIDNNVNVNYTPPDKLSPYQYALSRNFNEIAQMLSNAGAQ